MSTPPLPTLSRAMAGMQFRLTLLALGLAGLGAVLTSSIVIDSYLRQNLRLIANLAAYVAEPAIVFRDREAVRSAIEPLADRNGVRAIVITGGQGFHFRRAPIDQKSDACPFERPVCRLPLAPAGAPADPS
jgi:hypothetical protein